MKFMVMLEHFLVVQVHSQNTLLHLLTRFQKSQNQLIWLQQLLCPLQVQALSKAIEEHIKLRKGQKILIHGGSGGIGSLAIQLAKFHEAYVATTVSTSNIELAKQLGADEVIDYKTNDFPLLLKTMMLFWSLQQKSLIT